MWQSEDWNGLDAATRVFLLSGVVLIVNHLPAGSGSNSSDCSTCPIPASTSGVSFAAISRWAPWASSDAANGEPFANDRHPPLRDPARTARRVDAASVDRRGGGRNRRRTPGRRRMCRSPTSVRRGRCARTACSCRPGSVRPSTSPGRSNSTSPRRVAGLDASARDAAQRLQVGRRRDAAVHAGRRRRGAAPRGRGRLRRREDADPVPGGPFRRRGGRAHLAELHLRGGRQGRRHERLPAFDHSNVDAYSIYRIAAEIHELYAAGLPGRQSRRRPSPATSTSARASGRTPTRSTTRTRWSPAGASSSPRCDGTLPNFPVDLGLDPEGPLPTQKIMQRDARGRRRRGGLRGVLPSVRREPGRHPRGHRPLRPRDQRSRRVPHRRALPHPGQVPVGRTRSAGTWAAPRSRSPSQRATGLRQRAGHGPRRTAREQPAVPDAHRPRTASAGPRLPAQVPGPVLDRLVRRHPRHAGSERWQD